MLLRLFFVLLFVSPSFLLSQYDSWIDGKRTRVTHGYGSFMVQELWVTYVGVEHWEFADSKDVQWGFGGRISYLADDSRPGSREFRIGDRDYGQSLVLGLNYTVGANLFYVYDEKPNFSGRFRIEVPIGVDAVFGGGEKLEQILPVTENGMVIWERPIWHKESIALIRPSLGLNFAYTHSFSRNLAIGWQCGFVGILGMGVYIKGGMMLEIRHKTNH